MMMRLCNVCVMSSLAHFIAAAATTITKEKLAKHTNMCETIRMGAIAMPNAAHTHAKTYVQEYTHTERMPSKYNNNNIHMSLPILVLQSENRA